MTLVFTRVLLLIIFKIKKVKKYRGLSGLVLLIMNLYTKDEIDSIYYPDLLEI